MSESEDGGPGRRETAYRLFATEFEDADFSYAESDEERAPNYVVTPTGARINRLFVVGVLTEVQPVSDDVLRARIVDPTGAFVVYAGQYQPEAQAFLERADPPTFVAVSGKARTFQPEDSDVTYTSVRPESVNEVDADTRDRWTVQTAEQTLARIADVASALQSDVRGDELRSALEADGVSEGLAAGIPLAIDHYGTGGTYLQALRETALDAVRVVAGERDEVESRSVIPDATGEVDFSTLTDRHLDTSGATPAEPGAESPAGAVDEAIESTAAADSRAGSAAETDTSESESESVTTETSAGEEAVSSTASEAGEESVTATTSESDEAGDTMMSADTSEVAATTTSAETSGDSQSAETGTAEADTSEPGSTEESGDIGDFEPGEFDLDEETREEVESEYGTEFQSGAEVEEPGEADIETPDPEDIEAAESAGAPAGAADADPAPGSSGAPAGDESATPSESAATTDAVTETPETDTEVGADEEAGELDASATDEEEDRTEVDLEDAVMDAMRDLDDGDGADREGVIASVVEQYGADPDDVEEAVQDALMNGRCYEPDDETLTPI